MQTAENATYPKKSAELWMSPREVTYSPVGGFAFDIPSLQQEDDEQSIRATLRPIASGPWILSGLEGIPLSSGAVYYAIGDVHGHTQVLYDELIEINVTGDGLYITPRPVRDPSTEDPWAYDPSLWTHLVDAVRRAVGVGQKEESSGEVARLAGGCQELSGLNDSQLAALFPGEIRRETFNRWKNGAAARPTTGNLRRLGLLHRFFADLASKVSEPRTWLLQPMAGGAGSVYDLLKEGRLDEAEELLWGLGERPEGASIEPPGPSPLQLDEDAPPMDDEEGEYVEAEVDEDDDG